MDEKREDKRGLFLGIVGVLTLIVAIIGASFAYFSVNARSAEDAVIVTAASVRIVYADGQQVQASNLIPSTDVIALETQRRGLAGETYQKDGDTFTYETCKDDNGYTVCGTYDFSLTNNASNSVDVKATIEPSSTVPAVQFTHLKFKLFDVTGVTSGNGSNPPIHEGYVSYSEFGILGSSLNDTITIPGNGQVKNFRLFFWLDEAGADNDAEQGASFAGTINIDLAGANTNITGTASTAVNP